MQSLYSATKEVVHISIGIGQKVEGMEFKWACV